MYQQKNHRIKGACLLPIIIASPNIFMKTAQILFSKTQYAQVFCRSENHRITAFPSNHSDFVLQV